MSPLPALLSTASLLPKTVIEIQYHCYDSSRYPTVKLSVSGIIIFPRFLAFLTGGIRGKCLISSISGFLTVFKVRHGEEPARESTREKRGKKQKHWWEKKSSISGEQNGFPRFLAYKVVEFEENALQKTHASSKLPRKISRYHCETVSIFNDSFW